MGKSIHPIRFECHSSSRASCQHRACLQCTHCGRRLDTHNLSDRDGVPYCRSCYAKVCGGLGVAPGSCMLMIYATYPVELRTCWRGVRAVGQGGWLGSVDTIYCTRRQCTDIISGSFGARARHVVIGPRVQFSRRGSDPAGSGLLQSTFLPPLSSLRATYTTPSTPTAPYNSLHGALCPQIQGACRSCFHRRCTVLIPYPSPRKTTAN